MNRFLNLAMLLSVTLLFTQCKEENQGDDQSMELLAQRLPGDWDLIAVQYSGYAPNPLDSTQQYPFAGDATEVSGHFKFTADPNELEFEMNWKGEVDFGGGTSLTIPVSEQGIASWQVQKALRKVVGDATGMNGSNDTIPIEWTVVENRPNRQVWTTTQTFIWDGFNIPIVIDLKTTFVK